MLPVIALIGRPNVGKSTLFNRLTRSRAALVADVPGLTRDRQYGEGQMGDHDFIVIDTGGIGLPEVDIDEAMSAQTQLAIEEADVLLFLVDARGGMTAADEAIAAQLRRLGKPYHLVINKIDGLNPDVAQGEFATFGIADPLLIAASHGRGVKVMIDTVLADLKLEAPPEAPDVDTGIKIALVGRPNVGKSTLINRMLGEDRVVVYDMPGTTRDSIHIPFKRHEQAYTLIDTAGVRRRGKVTVAHEKFSIIKTLQAIEETHVAILLIDAQEGVTEQDLHLIGFILEAGKALVLAVNKWDGLSNDTKNQIRQELKRRLGFVDYVNLHFISALHGTGVGNLFESSVEAYTNAMREFSTNELTHILEHAVTTTPPPLVRGRRIKLRYAHPGGHNPPVIVIHGNQTERLPESYKRYLINTYRKALKLKGTPIRLILKSSKNPYEGRRNKLTPRQLRRRKRIRKK